MLQNRAKYSEIIKPEAKRLGFLSCGISKAEFLEAEAPQSGKLAEEEYAW